MSTKVNKTKYGMKGVETKNGIATFTASVYNNKLKTFRPLANGFNKELADEILGYIEAHKDLWDQGNWRQIQFADSEEFKELQLSMLAFEQDIDKPACGTAMCFAGWASEISKVDWVIDGLWIKRAGTVGGTYLDGVSTDVYSEYILVRHGGRKFAPRSLGLTIDDLPAALRDDLFKRGFNAKTHYLTTVEMAGHALLGIKDDPLQLFDGYNGIQRIKNIIDCYAEHGSEITVAEVRQFHEEFGYPQDEDSGDNYDEDDDE